MFALVLFCAAYPIYTLGLTYYVNGRIYEEEQPAEHPQAHRLRYMLKAAQHALRLMMDRQLDPLGLTTPQYNVLAAVQSQPGISTAAMARAAFVRTQRER